MKLLLKLLLFISFILIVIGYNIDDGKKLIGIGVLTLAFVLMPLFIYYRYKDRIGVFIDKRMEKPQDEEKSNN